MNKNKKHPVSRPPVNVLVSRGEWNSADDCLFIRAAQKWGSGSQIDMAIEEMAELIVDIQHSKRDMKMDKVPISKLAEEIADVTIMMRQLALLTDPDGVESSINRKMERLSRMVDG